VSLVQTSLYLDAISRSILIILAHSFTCAFQLESATAMFTVRINKV
jgi:hypothetical protein